MKKQPLLTLDQVKHIADLAKLPFTLKETKKFREQLSDILDFAAQIDQMDTKETTNSYLKTIPVNNFREDQIDNSRRLSQSEALSNAARVSKGYFVVKSIFKND